MSSLVLILIIFVILVTLLVLWLIKTARDTARILNDDAKNWNKDGSRNDE